MNLSKSKYCQGVQCLKILWLDKNMPEIKQDTVKDSVLDTGSEVGELARNLFGRHINISFQIDLSKMIEETKKVIDENENVIITEASFSYQNHFCSVDILKKNGNSYEIYEVKSSTKVEDIYLEDISYQVYVLRKCGYSITKASIVYLNSDYERVGDLELDKLFKIEDVTKIAFSKQKEVEDKIESIEKIMKKKEEPDIPIGMYCVEPYDCPFFSYCTRNLPEKNVFQIRNMRNSSKFSFYEKGIFKYEDLLKEDINEKYKEQIEYELFDKKDKIEVEDIKTFLDGLTYPLYFLDFETYQQAIPMYDYIKPYMQIPFQYSLHYIEKEGGKLKHKEFLAKEGIDPRRLLAEQLVKDIPLGVCTLAYNMRFEKSVIKNLAGLYKDLEKPLMDIHDNMQDLMIPFKDRKYYNRKMQGSFSIKYVLPALFPNDPSLDYHNLEDVHNGSEAMATFANLVNLEEEERNHLRYRLLKYCELDTYAMVKIWQKLLEVSESEEK